MIPEAVHAVTTALAAQLIAEQFPELQGLPLSASGQGWDNLAFEVGGEWLFRFPRRALGALPPDSSQMGAAQRTLVHGDLYGRHLLVDERGQLSGVIDWGDVHMGDAALDLALAFSFLPPEAHAEFRAAYGGPHEGCWARARFRAVHHSAVLLAAGAASGDLPLLRLSAQALAWLAAP